MFISDVDRRVIIIRIIDRKEKFPFYYWLHDISVINDEYQRVVICCPKSYWGVCYVDDSTIANDNAENKTIFTDIIIVWPGIYSLLYSPYINITTTRANRKRKAIVVEIRINLAKFHKVANRTVGWWWWWWR